MRPSEVGAGAAGPHPEPDLLALLALGEPVASGTTEHVEACPRCGAEVAGLTSVVVALRSAGPDRGLEAPSPEVWQSVQRELGLGEAAAPVDLAARRARRRWSTGVLLAASVAGVLVGSVASGLVRSDRSAPVASPPSVVASAQLAALPDHAGSGSAELVDTPTGTQLVLDVSGLSEGEGFYEVWLIDPETFAMVGLGALPGSRGTFPVPAGLDLSRYTIVDVSIEPYDGDPLHSKDSIVRGQLSS
jgi:hypothetical protein